MSNLFFRTNIAPYRIDTYNTLHKKLGCEMYFYWQQDTSQNFNEKGMVKSCHFTPHYLDGIRLGKQSRKLCTDVWKILKENKPEIVIVPEFQILTIQVLLYKFLYRKKFKIISMCDDSYDMVANNNDFTLVHKLARKLIAPIVDDILLVDSRVKDWYQTNYGKGIWLPIIRDEKNEENRYRLTLPISQSYVEKFKLQGKKVLLYVGRFDVVKNLDTLINAINKCNEDFITIFVGSGAQEKYLREQASKCKKEIIFAGHYVDDEVRAWYNVGDVFILPSKQEAFGAVTNEALIAGCKCLISEKAGSACLIDGKNGKQLNPNNPDSMAQMIDEFMTQITVRKEITQRPMQMNITFDETLDKVIQAIIS